MKINGLGLLATITFAASASADSSFARAAHDIDVVRGGLGDDVGEYSPISIDVYCKGVNWKSLTAKEEGASADMLMQAYNIVHQQLDGGDKYLAKVQFEGFTMDSEGDHDVGAMEVGRRRRRKQPTGSPHYKGGYGCKLCRDDDAVATSFVEWGMPDQQSLIAWEKKFEEMLKQGPHSALRGANKCDITMSPAQDVFDDEDDEDDGDKTNLRGGGGSIIMDHAGGAHIDKKGRTSAEY